MGRISDNFKFSISSDSTMKNFLSGNRKTSEVIHKCAIDQRYDVKSKLGDGSFGTVINAKPKLFTLIEYKEYFSPNSCVAIKILKCKISLNGAKAMKEYQFIVRVPFHPNIVKTLEFIFDPIKSLFYIVMEKCDMSLIHLMDSQNMQKFTNENLKLILYQILLGLAHIHKHGYFHRDIKPENILVTKVPVSPQQLFNSNKSFSSASRNWNPNYKYSSKLGNSDRVSTIKSGKLLDDLSSYIIKLTDFGLARETFLCDSYTSYISTRWYRAPEILLRQKTYGPPVDLWAFGSMAYEIANLNALFPGKNEADQVTKLINVLGTPSAESVGGSWPDFKLLTKNICISPVKVGIISDASNLLHTDNTKYYLDGPFANYIYFIA